MDARMPPTDRWPLRLSRPRASAPARNGLSRRSSARRNGTFIHERALTAIGLLYRPLVSMAPYSSSFLARLRCSMAATPPCSFSHSNTRPDKYQEKVAGVLYIEPLSAATL